MTDPNEAPDRVPPAVTLPVLGNPREAKPEPAVPRTDVASPVVRRHPLENWAIAGMSALGAQVRPDQKRPKVVAIDVSKGVVNASVRLQKKGLVEVNLSVPMLVEQAWSQVAEVFSLHTLAVARLLAGDLPEVFLMQLEERGVALLPPIDASITSRCDCDELKTACEHRAAVVELLAEEIARDPFVLFLLRGRERPEVLRLLGDEDEVPQTTDEPGATDIVEALPADPEVFWAAAQHEPVHLGVIKEPEVPAVLVRRLGEFPFWRGTRLLLPALERMYRRATKAAIDTLRGV